MVWIDVVKQIVSLLEAIFPGRYLYLNGEGYGKEKKNVRIEYLYDKYWQQISLAW